MATLKQWENLAHEAIQDAGEWKARTRTLERELNEIRRNVKAAARFACPDQYGMFDAALKPVIE